MFKYYNKICGDLLHILLCGFCPFYNKVILNIADALELLKAMNAVINSLCSSITTKFVNVKESYEN